MSLSEFISRNNEYPDPRIEWEKSRLLIKTIEESGAVQLFERLKESISSNLTFGEERRVDLRKLLFINNDQNIEEFIKLSGNDESGRGFLVKAQSRAQSDKLPYARIEFKYGAFWKPIGGTSSISPFAPFYVPQTRPSMVLDYYKFLRVDCNTKEELLLSSGGQHGRGYADSIVMKENQWRQVGEVDKALGKLYSRSPMRRVGE